MTIPVGVVGAWGAGGALIRHAKYEYDMRHDKGLTLQGDVKIVSCEEDLYRGEATGSYHAVIQVDGTIVDFSSPFSQTAIDYFESDKELIITYGTSDGVYRYRMKKVADMTSREVMRCCKECNYCL